MIKLILTDLDNTLLRSDKSISAYTLQVLKECHNQGFLIGFSSARGESASARFINATNPDVFISNGGATISVNGNIISETILSAETADFILSMCKNYTHSDITVEAIDGYYCNFVPKDPDRRAASKYSDFSCFHKPVYKITAELENPDWAAHIAHACPECSSYQFSGESWHRFASKEASKENAMRILADYLQLDLSSIAAFGDDINDLEMLRNAGMGIAVANAVTQVKASADHITNSNDEDGVARFIANHILSSCNSQ